VIAVGRFTKEEQNSVAALERLFGEEALKYMIVLFTRGDDLNDRSIQDYVRNGHVKLREVIQRCGSRFHVFNKKEKDRRQVVDLIKKVDDMLAANGGGHYTDEMYQEAESKIQQQNVPREQAELKTYDFSFQPELLQRVVEFQDILNNGNDDRNITVPTTSP
jgi:hypothetical protein